MAAPSRLLPQVLLCAFLWGAAFPLIKWAYASWPTTSLTLILFFAGFRFTLSGLGLLLFCKSPWKRAAAAPLKLLGALALTQTCLQYVFFYLAMNVSSGVLGALLVSCGSFWWLLLAPIFLNEPRAQGRDWIALLVCSLGIGLAVYAPGAGSGQVVLGTILFLLASLSGAIGVILMKPLSETLDAKTATGISLFIGGVFLLLLGAPSAKTFFALLDVKLALITAALAFISATAFSIWNRLAHTFPVPILASYRFLIPLSGSIQASLLIDGEHPGIGTIVGGSLILIALYVTTRPRQTDHSRE